jgi:hypothetical protein
MNANPLNYVRGLVDGLAGAIQRGEREAKTALTKELAVWLPELRAFEPGDEHAALKSETIAAAEAALPKTAAAKA